LSHQEHCRQSTGVQERCYRNQKSAKGETSSILPAPNRSINIRKKVRQSTCLGSQHQRYGEWMIIGRFNPRLFRVRPVAQPKFRRFRSSRTKESGIFCGCGKSLRGGRLQSIASDPTHHFIQKDNKKQHTWNTIISSRSSSSATRVLLPTPSRLPSTFGYTALCRFPSKSCSIIFLSTQALASLRFCCVLLMMSTASRTSPPLAWTSRSGRSTLMIRA